MNDTSIVVRSKITSKRTGVLTISKRLMRVSPAIRHEGSYVFIWPENADGLDAILTKLFHYHEELKTLIPAAIELAGLRITNGADFEYIENVASVPVTFWSPKLLVDAESASKERYDLHVLVALTKDGTSKAGRPSLSALSNAIAKKVPAFRRTSTSFVSSPKRKKKAKSVEA